MRTTRQTTRYATRAVAVLLSLAALTAAADRSPGPVSPGVDQLLKSARPAPGKGGKRSAQQTEKPRVATTKNGHIRTLAAAPSQYFPSPAIVPGSPQATVKGFFAEHAGEFGISHKGFNLVSDKVEAGADHVYLRYRQTYKEIPVAFTEIVVQANETGDVEYVSSDVVTDEQTPEVEGLLAVPPAVTAADAGTRAIDMMMESHPGLEFRAAPATLMIYQPTVIGGTGPVRLVWQTKVASVPDAAAMELVLIDAHSGEMALHYSLVKDALSRRVLDALHVPSRDFSILRRSEGDPRWDPWWVNDVDLAYDYLGDAYTFFWGRHGRDGLDNAGWTPDIYVFWGPYGVFDGFWSTAGYLAFGEDCLTDDVVAHEYAHAVMDQICLLIYWGESGAIAESLADMWAEWIDQTNNRGDDAAEVKWLIGEDLFPPWSHPDGRQALRSMKNPSEPPYYEADRKGSPYWQDCWRDGSDHGGVHTNAGVGNKLCYLLTDGDAFNGYTITGMGVDKVADLFYETVTRLLTTAADYDDLHWALLRAADNLGWTWWEKDNVDNACRAVEMAAVLLLPCETAIETEAEN